MMHKKTIFILLSMVCVHLLTVNTTRAEIVERQPELEKLIDTVEEHWAGINTYSVDFSATAYTGDVLSVQVNGEYYFKRPNKIRAKMHIIAMDGALE